MRIQNIYVTIDDSPSIHMHKKVHFLNQYNIPAVFYARGEFILKRPDQIINAIKEGFLIGNHSYTHPGFSTIDLKECFNEIIKTENLINECYLRANIERSYKIIRFPFADRGAGAQAAFGRTSQEREKIMMLQKFLKENNFIQLQFGQVNEKFIDSFWDWDTQDYKSKNIQDSKTYLSNLKRFYNSYEAQEAIMLMHDFDNNHHLFELTMDFLIGRNIKFLSPQVIL